MKYFCSLFIYEIMIRKKNLIDYKYHSKAYTCTWKFVLDVNDQNINLGVKYLYCQKLFNIHVVSLELEISAMIVCDEVMFS